jgi:hypothetical protein
MGSIPFFLLLVGVKLLSSHTALFNSSRAARAMLIAYDNLWHLV